MAILTGVIRGKVISGGAIVGSIISPFVRGLRAFLKLTHLAKLSSFGDKILENDSTVPKTIVDNNGIVQETTIINDTLSTNTLLNNAAPQIGAGGENHLPFDGQLDDVKIYNYELSASQVKKIMNEGAGTRFGD